MPDTLCCPGAQCAKAGKKTCFITFDQRLYIKAPSPMRSMFELPSMVACLFGLFPLISFIDVMRYVMFGLLRAQQANLCHEFGSANDVRPCIQPHTARSFPNTAGFGIHPLVLKVNHTALQDLWGCPAWWRCMTDAVEDPGSTIYAKTCSVVTLLPWIWTPSFWFSFSILFH